jgi:hypothetical protein
VGDLIDVVIHPLDAAWKLVVSETVERGEVKTVSGSRYAVSFESGSLFRTIECTVHERHPGVVDVELGPDGDSFGTEVTLRVSYAGTANDPADPSYHGRAPLLFWYNPEAETWVQVLGQDDPRSKTYTVQLKHFSRYAMTDGTGGWENAPPPPEGPDARANVCEH